jgi:hypothetical protein
VSATVASVPSYRGLSVRVLRWSSSYTTLRLVLLSYRIVGATSWTRWCAGVGLRSESWKEDACVARWGVKSPCDYGISVGVGRGAYHSSEETMGLRRGGDRMWDSQRGAHGARITLPAQHAADVLAISPPSNPHAVQKQSRYHIYSHDDATTRIQPCGRFTKPLITHYFQRTAKKRVE